MLPPPLVVSTLDLPWRVEDGGLEGMGHVLLTPTRPCLVFSVWNRDGTWWTTNTCFLNKCIKCLPCD